MTWRGKQQRLGIIMLAIISLLQVGCGRKTLPIPPYEAVPEAISDLQYQQDENQVSLVWTYPNRTTVGSDLPGLQSFMVLRAVVPEQDYCPGCPVTFSSAVEVEAAAAITDTKKRQAHYTETILRAGHRYLYKVQTKAGWRLVSDDSNTVSFFWDSPALAPDELVGQAGDGQVVLRWQAVASLVNNDIINGPVHYQVYRGLTPESIEPVGDAVFDTTYTDSGLVNGQMYHYQIRAVRQVNGSRLIGLASHPVGVAPTDLTPPAPPRNLTGVLVKGGVKLLWERSTEKDLAGYRIFRRLPNETALTVIGEVDRAAMSFVDQLPQAPDGCYWAITAFDRATPTNESAFSKELYHEPF
jgi:hypothetical protein